MPVHHASSTTPKATKSTRLVSVGCPSTWRPTTSVATASRFAVKPRKPQVQAATPQARKSIPAFLPLRGARNGHPNALACRRPFLERSDRKEFGARRADHITEADFNDGPPNGRRNHRGREQGRADGPERIEARIRWFGNRFRSTERGRHVMPLGKEPKPKFPAAADSCPRPLRPPNLAK